MTHQTDTDRGEEPHGPLAVTNDQYSAFGYDGRITLYDPANTSCWLQSDTTVDLLEAV